MSKKTSKDTGASPEPLTRDEFARAFEKSREEVARDHQRSAPRTIYDLLPMTALGYAKS